MDALLSASDIVLSYGQSDPVLRGASLRVDSGEFIALMGRSGSGKTTFLYTLAGLLRPDSGTIIFAGEDLASASDERLSALRRSAFGFVFQFGELVPELSLLENIALPQRLAGVRKRSANGVARELLDRLGLGDLAQRRPGEVSGGQAQRAAVARAVAHSPQVVFADEPTGSLDSENGDEVLAVLLGLAREVGTALCLVTHDERVAAFADRVVAVRDGAVVPQTVAPC